MIVAMNGRVKESAKIIPGICGRRADQAALLLRKMMIKDVKLGLMRESARRILDICELIYII